MGKTKALEKKPTNSIYYLVCIITYFAFFLVLYVFFVRYGYHVDGDFKYHIAFAKELKMLSYYNLKQFINKASLKQAIAYPLWHFLYYIVYNIALFISRKFEIPINDVKLFDNSIMAIVNIFFLFLATVVTQKILRFFLKDKLNRYFGCFASVASSFIGPIPFFKIIPNYYLGNLVANPWHNPTYFAVRFTALIAFYLACYIVDNYDELKNSKIRLKHFKCNKVAMFYIAFSFAMLLSQVAKPNFLQIFAPALFVFCGFNVLMNKFKTFHMCLYFGLALVPSCILFLLQYGLIAQSDGYSQLHLGLFTVWKAYSPSPIRSVFISFVFPIFVCVFCFKDLLKSNMMQLAGITLLSSISQASLFYFTPNTYTGDFFWGTYLATNILFVACFIAFVNHKLYEKLWFKLLGYGILAAHCLFGTLYFCGIFSTFEIL